MFDELKTRLEFLLANPDRDSEAARHDALIVPFLTSEAGLGWTLLDLVPQQNIIVPDTVGESYIFRNAQPTKRIPDLLIRPADHDIVVAAIEEKEHQPDVKVLNQNHLQLREYQALCECTWGILTDGEKWIIKRNFESWGEFGSIDELEQNLREIREVIGRNAVVARIKSQGSPDLILVQSGPLLMPARLPAHNLDFDVVALTDIWVAQLPDHERETLFKSWAITYSPAQLKDIQKELVRRGSLLKEVEFFSMWMDHARESFLAVNELIRPKSAR